MTQTEMAERSGLNQQTISDYERGLRIPSLPTAYNIARALEVTIDEVVEAIKQQEAG